MGERLCAISVDLDEIGCYRALHGLPPREDRGAGAVHDVALERIGSWAAPLQVPLTLFVVGAELERAASADALRELTVAGHLGENHSHSHRYDLTLLGPEAMQAEVARAQEAIASVTGRVPTGFRAPGYTVNDALLDVLERLGLQFDSSVFPCPAYYLAKAAAMARLRCRGRPTKAILDTPRVWLAPARPYRPSRPCWHRRGARRLVELPVQVTPRLRLPVIGTSLVLAGPRAARWLVRRCAGAELINLELHGIDFLDGTDGLADLAAVQPDLRRPVSEKLAVFRGVWTELRAAGYRFVTLAEAASHFAASCPSSGLA